MLRLAPPVLCAISSAFCSAANVISHVVLQTVAKTTPATARFGAHLVRQKCYLYCARFAKKRNRLARSNLDTVRERIQQMQFADAKAAANAAQNASSICQTTEVSQQAPVCVAHATKRAGNVHAIDAKNQSPPIFMTHLCCTTIAHHRRLVCIACQKLGYKTDKRSANKELQCNVCHKEKHPVSYEENVLHNHLHNNRLLVCMPCQKMGYSSDPRTGSTSYRCAAGHDLGHHAFDGKDLDNAKTGHTSARQLVCKKCKERPMYACSIGRYRDKMCYEWCFNEQMLKSFKRQSKGTSRLVCNNCCSRGYSTQHRGDVARHCNLCSEWLGPQKFDVKNDAKKAKLICKDCKKKPPRVEPP